MATRSATLECTREMLSQAIADVLDSWPAVYREVFTNVRYGGRSIEEAARSAGVSADEARALLAVCDRKLREGLRAFRNLEPSV